MGRIYFPIAGIGIIALISLIVTMAPATVEDISQGTINTSALQDSTDLEGTGIEANATAETSGLVDQASTLASVLSNPSSGNRLLAYLFTLILVGLIAWLIATIRG